MTTHAGRAARLLLIPATALLLLGCGAQHQATPQGKPSTPGGVPVKSAEEVDLARLNSTLVDQAEGSDSTPTAAGLTVARQVGRSVSFFWETTKGKVCFAQTAVSGGTHETACGDPKTAVPVAGSKLAAMYGPGMGFSESYVVFAADPGDQVTSVTYKGNELSWKFIRRLSPQTTGRDVYYVTLPDRRDDWLQVTLRSEADEKSDRLWVGHTEPPK
ncbi:hypothetical protein ACWDYJ_04695 [Streptomyces sp. NPDC003042]